jgi:hypothetical protein
MVIEATKESFVDEYQASKGLNDCGAFFSGRLELLKDVTREAVQRKAVRVISAIFGRSFCGQPTVRPGSGESIPPSA